MAKVHPNNPANTPSPRSDSSLSVGPEGEKTVMTVWRKSLMFNGKGFTVFDAKGALLYRVDNYVYAGNTEIVLMDAAGKCLMTVRRKRLSLGENWLIYRGEDALKPCFTVKKNVSIFPTKEVALVTPCGPGVRPSYTVEGSYTRRHCGVYDALHRRPLVEVQHKASVSGVDLGGDVFRLTVLSGFDQSLAMAVVLVLEQMFR